MEKPYHETAAGRRAQRSILGFWLVYEGGDSVDFFENLRGSISIGQLQKLVDVAYAAGVEDGRKEGQKSTTV